MAESRDLVALSDAAKAVAHACTVVDCNRLIDMAQAVKAVAHTDEMKRKASELYLRARRRRGEVERELPKAKGGQPYQSEVATGSREASTLAELGIDKREASVDYKLLDIPDEAFEEYVSSADDITTAGALRMAKRVDPRATPELRDGTYRVIYADPPWMYGQMQHSREEQETTLDTHYPQMPTDEIAALPVKKWLPSDAVLFLWTTSPKLYEAEEVIDGWGFQYKASIIWDKVKHNVGYYVSVRHEFLLVCTRGSCLPDVKKLEDSVVSIERGEHSVKPPYFREWIDRMYPPVRGRVDRIEMFARGEIPAHWARWGGET